MTARKRREKRGIIVCAALAAVIVSLGASASATCIPPPSGLTGWWPGNSSVADTQGGRDATLQFGAGYGTGFVGPAFQLDGADDFVAVADDAALDVGSGDFSVDLWVNFDTTSGEQVMVEKWVQGSPITGWTLTKRNDDSIEFATAVGSARSAALPLSTNTWTHVAARRSSGNLAIFVNGVSVATASAPGNLDTPSSLKFGHRGNPSDTPGSGDTRGFYLDGQIDEVQLFVGHALSDTEIQDIVAAGSDGQCNGPPVCGNSITESGEQCDDGNMVADDGCENDCTRSCGNGATTGTEQCDDANAINGDGCDNNCTFTGCGNGIPTAPESCDDGNAVDGDGCDGNCTVSGCGNGVIAGAEQCEDGNTDNGDGCDNNCTFTGCGNGVQTAGEQCDDGNASNGDPCRNDCAANVCGDTFVNTGVEECDDGNLVDADGCDADCTVGTVCVAAPVDTSGWWPAGGTSSDIQGGFNATLRNGATYGLGKVGQAFSLDGDDDFVDVADNPALDAGNGDFTVDLWINFNDTAGEQVLVEKYVEKYDPAASTGWTLTKLNGNTVRFVAVPYSLDAGHLSLPAHTWLHFAARRLGSTMSIFLNGGLVASRTFDHAGNLDTASSLKFGHRGSPLDTPGSGDTRGFFVDGVIDEVHLVIGRGLSDGEIQAIHAAGKSGECVPPPVCGNGRAEAGEACDDGNATGDDGCENDCSPSCGNGVATAGEACDDGNAIDGDGCDHNCTTTGCGNGILTVGEQCEDDNAIGGDGCDVNCAFTACGNGIATPSTGEVCDDGNLIDGDGCESTCTLSPVSATVGAGGSVNTDPHGVGATPQFPVQTSVTTQQGGTVTIAPPAVPGEGGGLQIVGAQLQIDAPPATVEMPLIIVLTVDASAIPEGVDPSRLDVTRDGSLIEDCTGALGTASPDPCIESRTPLGGGDVRITVLTSHASLWGVVVRGLFRGEQRCVNGANAAAVKMARAQATTSAACLRAAAQGQEPNAQACLGADGLGKVGRAAQRATSVTASLCASSPPFGYTSAASVIASPQQVQLDLLADLFGADLTAAVISGTDRAGSTCQAAVLVALQKVFDANTRTFLRCKKDGVAGRSSLMVSSANLATCFTALRNDATGKIVKATTSLARIIAHKCEGIPLVAALPGSCAAAEDVAYCLDTRVDCRICRLFNAVDGLGEDCDLFDDGSANNSCN